MASEVINCGTAAVNMQWKLWARDADIKKWGMVEVVVSQLGKNGSDRDKLNISSS